MLEKYRPTKFSEVVGNKTAIQTIGRWFLTWPAVSSCVLVSGPCGVGKTLVIDLLTKQPEYNVMEVNSDDDRNNTFIQQRVVPFTKTKKNVWGKSNVLIVNDIDVSNDHGFLGALSSCIKETKIPIILTCNERYEPKIKPVASLCTDVKFYKPTSQEVSRYITDMVKKELGIAQLTTSQTQMIQNATETAEGDVRNAILSTEFAIISGTPDLLDKSKNKKDIVKPNLFDTTTNFMSQLTDLDTKLELLDMEDLLPLMVYENYPRNIIRTKETYEQIYHLRFASSAMSDYDLMPYAEAGATSIIQSTNVCHPKTKIEFTRYLGKMSSKTKKANVIADIESRLPMSLPLGHFRLDYMSYMLQIVYNQINNPSAFVEKAFSFGFTKEDIQDNLPVILIADGAYSRYDYSNVDKKVKASLTKTFSKQLSTDSEATANTKAKAPPKTATKKSTTPKAKTTTTSPSAEKKATPAPAPAPKKTTASKKKEEPITITITPVTEVPSVSVTNEQSQTHFPTPEPGPSPTKTATIVRKRNTKKVASVTEPAPLPTQPTDPVVEVTEPVTEVAPEKPKKTIVRKRASKPVVA